MTKWHAKYKKKVKKSTTIKTIYYGTSQSSFLEMQNTDKFTKLLQVIRLRNKLDTTAAANRA